MSDRQHGDEVYLEQCAIDAQRCPCFNCRKHLKAICIDHQKPEEICGDFAIYVTGPKPRRRKRQ